jgi:hypothetical protein
MESARRLNSHSQQLRQSLDMVLVASARSACSTASASHGQEGGEVPIPALTAAGYLPVGMHDCALDEVEATFGTSPHRLALLNRLRDFLQWLRNDHGLDLPYFVDGSFATGKPHPDDVDFVLDLTTATQQQIAATLQLFHFHQQDIKQNFRIDFWWYHPGAQKDLRAFFQYVRVEELQRGQLPPDTRKGILRLQP